MIKKIYKYPIAIRGGQVACNSIQKERNLNL